MLKNPTFRQTVGILRPQCVHYSRCSYLFVCLFVMYAVKKSSEKMLSLWQSEGHLACKSTTATLAESFPLGTSVTGVDHRSIYKYLDGGLLSLSIDQMRAPQTQLSCPACITLTHARQPNLSSVRKFQNEISLGRRAHVRKMFVSLTHSPDSAYNIHIYNKV